MNRLLLFILSSAFLISCETTPDKVVPETEGAAAAPAEVMKPYPLTTCLVTDEPLGSRNDDRTVFHGDQEVKVCCAACLMSFKLSPDKYLAKLP
ncbi:MAG: hypothetical protein MI807_09415 [Verrucomicrobiales bacterium]|nr:hypothetical protein [Verrucomicrobiales bacterium]